MEDNRISIQEFADYSGYSQRQVYNLIKTNPELIGYDPFSNTCGLNKALEIVEIQKDRYNVYWAADRLLVTPRVVRHWAKIKGFGRKVGGVSSTIYLTINEVNAIGKLVKKY